MSLNIQQTDVLTKPSVHIKLLSYLEETYNFKYDCVRNTFYYKLRGGGAWKETDPLLIWDKAQRAGHCLSRSYIEDLCASPEVSPSFNPILDYFKELPSKVNGNPIARFCELLKLTNDCKAESERVYNAVFKWFLGSVYQLHTDYVHKHMLVFKGPTGIGKSHLCRHLLPTTFKDLVTECPSLNPDNKDCKVSLANSWLVILDEVDDYLKTKANRDNIKSYLTTSAIRLRLPYARKESTMSRRASVVATCNESRFLNDPTGSQRYIVIELVYIEPWSKMCKGAPKGLEDFDMNSCWAFAYQAYKLGVSPMLSHTDLIINEKKNQAYTYVAQEAELLDKYYDVATATTPSVQKLTASDIKLAIEAKINARLAMTPLGSALTKKALECDGFKVTSRGISRYYVKEKVEL